MKEDHQREPKPLCCPVCGSVVQIDEDNDLVRCRSCGAKWESFTSFEDELDNAHKE